MHFWHDFIPPEFPEIRLNWNQEIMAKNGINLTNDDGELIDNDEIKVVILNKDSEFEAREGEK